MKASPQSLRIVALTIVACLTSPAFAATEATTDPVGFITLNITGTGGGDPKYSFKGLSLTQTVDYQGAAETSTGGASALVDNEAIWTDNQFNGAAAAITHYVEITSGSSAGTTYDIIGTVQATKTLTLAQPLAPGTTDGSTFKVRKHWTISSVFGPNNEAGLFGGTVGTADQVLIYNSAGNPPGFKTYYFKSTGPGGVGWRSTESISADESPRIIYPDDGMVIKRTQSSDANIVLSGSVKTGQSSYPISVGNNFIANVYGTALTLGSSGLYTGSAVNGLLGGTSGTADQVLIWNGVGYDAYYYKTTGPGGTGWRSTASISDPSGAVASTPIPLGSSVVIVRKYAAAGFDWVIPQHPSSF